MHSTSGKSNDSCLLYSVSPKAELSRFGQWPSSGKRSLALADLRRPGRRQLVGLLADDPQHRPDEGEQIVASDKTPPGTRALGFVSSSYMSPTLGRSFSLAMLADGRAKIGQTVYTVGEHGAHPARVVEPVFYDREGSRLDA